MEIPRGARTPRRRERPEVKVEDLLKEQPFDASSQPPQPPGQKSEIRGGRQGVGGGYSVAIRQSPLRGDQSSLITF